MAGGACHCDTVITLLFPFGTIVEMRTGWSNLGMLLTVVQFPLYAAIVAGLTKSRPMAVLLLLILHTAAVVVGRAM